MLRIVFNLVTNKVLLIQIGMNHRPIPKPVPRAATHNVEKAAEELVRLDKSAADQKDVANSDEIVAKNPNHAIQNLIPNLPLCLGASQS